MQVCLTAVVSLITNDRVAGQQVNPAMMTAHQLRRYFGCPLLSDRAWMCHETTQKPYAAQNHRQEKQRLHSVLPSTTSITKREPT